VFDLLDNICIEFLNVIATSDFVSSIWVHLLERQF